MGRDPESTSRGVYAENLAHRDALTEVAGELERLECRLIHSSSSNPKRIRRSKSLSRYSFSPRFAESSTS